MAATKAPSVEAILDALRRHPDSTATQLAEAAGIGRSTGGKALAVLEAEGFATRRQPTSSPGAKNAPERWTLTSQTPVTTTNPHSKPTLEPASTSEQPAAEQPTTTPVEAADPLDDAGPSQPAMSALESGEATATDPHGETIASAANQAFAASPRLRPGELRSLIHTFLAERPGQELTPTKIGRELGRSAGAVSNALATMTDAGEIAQTSIKPRKYTLTTEPSKAADTGGKAKAS